MYGGMLTGHCGYHFAIYTNKESCCIETNGFFFNILFIFLRERQPAKEGTQAGGVGEEEAGS